jgi:glycosyltransferase involved in cell wall biosynthesis
MRAPAPDISVVVTNYNHGRYLPQSLDAILAQTTLPAELIIIDDASTDNSAEIIASYRARHDFIRVVQHETNQGVLPVISRALTEARCDYVLSTAADDWILPGLLEAAGAQFAQHPEAGLCSALSLVTDERGSPPRIFPTPSPLKEPGYIAPQRARELLLEDDSWFMGNTVVLNRKAALAMGGFRRELRSLCDSFLYRQLALQHGACFVPVPLGVWRRLPTGYSSSTLVNFEQMNAMLDAARRAMRDEYPNLFDAEYIRRFEGRWRYAITLGLDPAAPGATAALLRALDHPTWFDRMALRVARRRLLARPYLFLRTRPFDIGPTLRRRIGWYLHGKADKFPRQTAA